MAQVKQTIKVKSMITGKEITVGPNFLNKQPKPVIGPDGKGYKDGEYVAAGTAASKKKSVAAEKIIEGAKTEKKLDPLSGVDPV